jgi:hypothetical protein
MNKLKLFFFIIFCLASINGAASVSAQTAGDKILVAGKQPLKQSEINGLIDFYEWAFEAKFTAEQRERFKNYTVNEYRSDIAGNRKTIDDISTMLPQILAASEGVQAETRKNFLAEFMPEARKHDDENARMLVGIYDAAHGGEQEAGAASSAENTASRRANDSNNAIESAAAVGDLSGLVGEWVWGRSGSSTYTTGGALVGSNGSRHTYQFAANGAVEYTGIMNMMSGGCNMQIFKTMKGRASLNGDTLTINWSPASFSRADSCSPSKDYKKTLPAETETFKVAFKDSYGQKQLCLTGKDETCFSPTK